MKTECLRTADGRASMEIAVDFGCNLCSWQVEGRELLYREAAFGQDPARVYEAGGTPLLFPAVGRTWDRSVTPAVPERYRLTGHAAPLTMPNHGILPLGCWEPVDATPQGDTAVAEFRFTCAAGVLARHYPFNVELRHRFTLRRRSLDLEATFVNRGSGPAPVAFGWHPYWLIAADAVTVSLPCTQQIELDPQLLVPSGRTQPFGGDLQVSVPDECDVAFGGTNGTCATLRDAANGYTVTMAADDHIGNWVIYSGADQRFVCVEPWTPGLGQYERLNDPAWIGGAHLPVLAPNATRHIRCTFIYDTP